MSISLSELQLVIAEFCDTSTLANLILTCKDQYALLNELLYRRNVKLEGASSIFIAIQTYGAENEARITAVIDLAEKAGADLNKTFPTKFEKHRKAAYHIWNSFLVTPLYMASILGLSSVVKHLVDKGVDVHAKTLVTVSFGKSRLRYQDRHTALYGAVWANHRHIVTILQASCQTEHDRQALLDGLTRVRWPEYGVRLAAAANAMDLLMLIGKEQLESLLAFSYVVDSDPDDISVIANLIEFGLDVNAKQLPRDCEDLVKRPLAQACAKGRFDIALLLIRAGAEVHGEFPSPELWAKAVGNSSTLEVREGVAIDFAIEAGRRSLRPMQGSPVACCPSTTSTFECFLEGILSIKHGYPSVVLILLFMSCNKLPFYPALVSSVEMWRHAMQGTRQQATEAYCEVLKDITCAANKVNTAGMVQ